MKSASNYDCVFEMGVDFNNNQVVGGCVGALFHMSVNYADIIFTMRLVCTVSSDRRYYNRGNVQSV